MRMRSSRDGRLFVVSVRRDNYPRAKYHSRDSDGRKRKKKWGVNEIPIVLFVPEGTWTTTTGGRGSGSQAGRANEEMPRGVLGRRGEPWYAHAVRKLERTAYKNYRPGGFRRPRVTVPGRREYNDIHTRTGSRRVERFRFSYVQRSRFEIKWKLI